VIRFAETTVAEAMIPIAEATVIGRSETAKVAIDLTGFPFTRTAPAT
jgi:hypothetical protein